MAWGKGMVFLDRTLTGSEILAPMKSRKSVVGDAVVMDEAPKEQWV